MATALITVITGFIGHHLARRLASSGWRVVGAVRATSARPDGDPGGGVACHELTDPGGLRALVAATRPEVVFHLASQFIAEHVPTDVPRLVESNILFGAELLEAMAASGVRRLVNVGTAWQHRTGDGYEPVNLYAATKQAFSDIAAYYRSAEGLRIATVALYDTYGPFDRRRKLVPLLLSALESGEPLAMSPGDQLVDLVYVDDVVAALERASALIGDALADGEAAEWAAPAAAELTLRELVGAFSKAFDAEVRVQWGARPWSYRRREVMRPWQGCPRPGLVGARLPGRRVPGESGRAVAAEPAPGAAAERGAAFATRAAIALKGMSILASLVAIPVLFHCMSAQDPGASG